MIVRKLAEGLPLTTWYFWIALAIAGLYSVYGGSTDAADKTISTASEINSDYVFSYGGNENPTEPTTETTTEVPTETVTDKPDKLVGDINSDGQISVSDVVLLQRYILKFETFTKEKYEIADINSDNKVNVIDHA